MGASRARCWRAASGNCTPPAPAAGTALDATEQGRPDAEITTVLDVAQLELDRGGLSSCRPPPMADRLPARASRSLCPRRPARTLAGHSGDVRSARLLG